MNIMNVNVKLPNNDMNGMHICMQLLKMGLGLPPSYSRCTLT